MVPNMHLQGQSITDIGILLKPKLVASFAQWDRALFLSQACTVANSWEEVYFPSIVVSGQTPMDITVIVNWTFKKKPLKSRNTTD